MQIELTEDEARVLSETLKSVLSNLSVEIADTDKKSFRDGLKQRRDMLRDIAARLEST